MTPVVALLAMRQLPRSHEQLISLHRLCLDGRALEFAQAFLSVSTKDNLPSWSCTVRGVSIEEASRLQGELELRAEAIDGRTIEGRVGAPGSVAPSAEAPAVLELVGVGSPLIEGRTI
jgi:hypothetical protein